MSNETLEARIWDGEHYVKFTDAQRLIREMVAERTALESKLDGAVKNAVMIDRARLSIAEQLEDSQRARKNIVQACEAYKEELTAARDAALAEGVRAGEMESRLDYAEGTIANYNTARDDEHIKRVCNRLESSDPEFDDCAAAVQLIVHMQLERQASADWKARAIEERQRRVSAESRLGDAEARLNGIKALRVEMVDLIGADLDATLQGLLWPRDVEKVATECQHVHQTPWSIMRCDTCKAFLFKIEAPLSE